MSEPNLPESATGVGLGYGIAIAVGILVLISTIMLASYVCVRVKAGTGVDSTEPNHQASVDHSPEPFVVVGLDKPTIDSYPKLIVGESRRLPKPNNGPCSICLSEYRPKDIIRWIPECHHCFHVDCIDEWLRTSPTCPLCRNSPAPSAGPSPVATPLLELVPLAFYAR